MCLWIDVVANEMYGAQVIKVLICCEELGLRCFHCRGDPNIVLPHGMAGASTESVDLCIAIYDGGVVDIDRDEAVK